VSIISLVILILAPVLHRIIGGKWAVMGSYIHLYYSFLGNLAINVVGIILIISMLILPTSLAPFGMILFMYPLLWLPIFAIDQIVSSLLDRLNWLTSLGHWIGIHFVIQIAVVSIVFLNKSPGLESSPPILIAILACFLIAMVQGVIGWWVWKEILEDENTTSKPIFAHSVSDNPLAKLISQVNSQKPQ